MITGRQVTEVSRQPAAPSAGAAEQFLVFNEVTQAYRLRRGTELAALQGIQFAVRRNEFVVFVGASGCGKTTLLKIAAGLLEPTAGEVLLNGVPPRRFRRDGIGMVFQNPVLLPWRTVRENVLLPIEIFGFHVREFREKADRLLAMAGLAGFENGQTYELSGGMQQRVAMCRALVSEPEVLLMDEPLAALDALTREQMAIELLRIWEATKTTVLFVTHSVSEAVLLADRVVVMTPRPGRINRIVEGPLPRPRQAEMEFAREFLACKEEIRSAIYDLGRGRDRPES